MSAPDYAPVTDWRGWMSAATEFTRIYPVRTLTVHQVALGFSRLAITGYIVNPIEHEKLCNSYAVQLSDAQVIAADLSRRLSEGGDL